jgi:hypothetical protein
MSETYINRFTCDFCHREADSVDGEMPDGWRMVLVNTRRADGGLDVARHHYCSWHCEQLTEAGVGAGVSYLESMPVELDLAKLKVIAERLRDDVTRQTRMPWEQNHTLGNTWMAAICTCEQATASFRAGDLRAYCINCGKPI